AFGAKTLEESLLALARLDAGEAIALLSAHKELFFEFLSREALVRTVNAAISEELAVGHGRVSRELLIILRDFRDVVSTDMAVAVIAATPNRQGNPVVSEVLDMYLKRDPGHGPMIKLAAEVAISSRDLSAGHELLTRLTQADDSMATVNSVFKL